MLEQIFLYAGNKVWFTGAKKYNARTGKTAKKHVSIMFLGMGKTTEPYIKWSETLESSLASPHHHLIGKELKKIH